ncbi:MAG TPA: hypothetical protein DCF61_05180 [Alphaproteobacteria bacterium]|nr:hypothetical protein [Alphaproteobacteria bacterium]
MQNLRGIITWFRSNDVFANPNAYLDWATMMASKGKRFAILGDFGFSFDKKGDPVSSARISNFLELIGLQEEGTSIKVTFDVRPVIADRNMVEFEHALAGRLPAYNVVQARDTSAARRYLILRSRSGLESDAVVTTHNAGYAASGYVLYELRVADTKRWIKKWRINPFRFFAEVFEPGDNPVPDTTTRAGRRIFYSHIDGDGLANISWIERYKEKPILSARVVLDEVLKKFPDMPVTVAPIAADIDPKWHGSKEAREVIRETLALPNVEVGSHTFSHPFDWGFFANNNHRELEKFFFQEYPAAEKLFAKYPELKQQKKLEKEKKEGLIKDRYERPRAYALEPFSVELEVIEANRVIEELAPEHKRVEVIQWSGNTQPFEAVLKGTREAGIANINGGDTRFDPEFASFAWVAPVGLQVGEQVQVYASNSNENTYTEDWTDRFFGFRFLENTARNTNSPIRLKPLNVYYHYYSGEREAALNALIMNYKHAQELPLLRMRTSEYARIGEGFFSTRIIRLGKDSWRIEERGALNTIRFDRALYRAVDFDNSHGVIGQMWLHGSLYVSLDPQAIDPVIALKSREKTDQPAFDARPYLLEAQWDVRNWRQVNQEGFTFSAKGFGQGEIKWVVTEPGSYQVILSDGSETLNKQVVQVSEDGILAFSASDEMIGPWMERQVHFLVSKVNES